MLHATLLAPLSYSDGPAMAGTARAVTTSATCTLPPRAYTRAKSVLPCYSDGRATVGTLRAAPPSVTRINSVMESSLT